MVCYEIKIKLKTEKMVFLEYFAFAFKHIKQFKIERKLIYCAICAKTQYSNFHKSTILLCSTAPSKENYVGISRTRTLELMLVFLELCIFIQLHSTHRTELWSPITGLCLRRECRIFDSLPLLKAYPIYLKNSSRFSFS